MLKFSSSMTFLSERAALVDRAHSKAVAISMVDVRKDKQEEWRKKLESQLYENEAILERYRAECKALQIVYKQQLALISELERGSV